MIRFIRAVSITMMMGAVLAVAACSTNTANADKDKAPSSSAPSKASGGPADSSE